MTLFLYQRSQCLRRFIGSLKNAGPRQRESKIDASATVTIRFVAGHIIVRIEGRPNNGESCLSYSSRTISPDILNQRTNTP